MQVSAWSGDRIETIEKNYWHKRTEGGALDATMAGIKKDEETAKQLAAILAAAQGQQLHSSSY